MQKKKSSVHYYCCLLFLSLYLISGDGESSINIPVGVILDLNSSVGAMVWKCITMAHTDFYNNSNYQTRLSLQPRNSENDVLTAASAAQDLIVNETVRAIIGPQNSKEASFVIEVGSRSSVPIISFSPTTVSLSPTHTNQNDNYCSMFKAIASIIESYGWHEIIPIYEDTQYGNSVFIPCLLQALDALQEMNTHLPYKTAISVNSGKDEIVKELIKLKGMQTKVFLAHITNGTLGSIFFQLADEQGMMKQGFAWIVTQSDPSIIVDPTAPRVSDFMQGALGVRPFVDNTNEELEDFKRRWKVESNITNLTLLGLWAYDTVQVLATAVENASVGNSGVDLANAISSVALRGLSGNFSLKEGQVGSSIFEVYNVIGQTERIVGYWSPQRGLVKNVSDDDNEHKLKGPIIWPGDTEVKPPKLRIGVLVREGSFSAKFAEVKWENSPNGTPNEVFSGFAVDLFREVVEVLPFGMSYDFVRLNAINETYDRILCQIKEKAIGDITISENRTKCVDFTLAYIASSVSMVVARKENLGSVELLKPFDWTLWTILSAILLVSTLTIISLEVSKHDDDEQKKKVFKDILTFPFSVFSRDPESKDWKSSLSKWVAFMCSIIFLMAVQIYTASLTNMLAEEAVKPKPRLKDVQEIIDKKYHVGYQNASGVKQFLIQQLQLDESQLKAYRSPEEYNRELTLKTKNGGVDAIFDETPYLTTFLSIDGYDNYTMVGTKYPSLGFAFAFPQKSGLVSYFSDGILEVVQNKTTFEGLENKYSLHITSDFQTSDSNFRRLSIHDFLGFIWMVVAIIGVFLLVAFLRECKIRFPCLCQKFSSSSSRVSKQAMSA
ncbi:glutamate receptor 2.8-like [Senna tora]|uniref:Glutamate receptor 2.8-like n=1 Tax=Senna tora TaxID=362788 RepID=A0A834TP56_9FABA|nr:glutamate receptor 2.8-like [Senna tora]